MKKGCLNSFTLAEVLITLGIIGIVAAMTLPALLSNAQNKIFENQRKKAANILANGYKKMLADTEQFYVKDLPLFTVCDSDECVKNEHKKVFAIINDGFGDIKDMQMPSEYKNAAGNLVSVTWADYTYVFVTTDGFTYGLLAMDLDFDDEATFFKFNVLADVNGKKNPNEIAKDLVVYNVNASGTVTDVTCSVLNCGNDGSGSGADDECSAANPRACKTLEECDAIGASFRDGICEYRPA